MVEEEWIFHIAEKYKFGYIEVAYTLHSTKSRLFTEEIIKISKNKKICLSILVPLMVDKIGVN